MANKKFTDLDPAGANPTLVDTDILAVTLDPANTPVSRKTSISNLMTKAPVQSVAGRTGAVTLSDTDISGLGTAATTDSADYATAAHTHALNDLSDLTITSASNEDVIKFNGTSFVNGQVSVDVDTPLSAALRGTDNPHIGAFPDQSFRVTDNPNRSVMVIADADGNLEFVVNNDAANIYLRRPNSLVAAAFGFSISEDSLEPDIEVEGTLGGSVEKYSVISGDSDTKDTNGLPLRQGFNLPDIGAFSSPLLISGGSIA